VALDGSGASDRSNRLRLTHKLYLKAFRGKSRQLLTLGVASHDDA
jgi:hypothetical protein